MPARLTSAAAALLGWASPDVADERVVRLAWRPRAVRRSHSAQRQERKAQCFQGEPDAYPALVHVDWLFHLMGSVSARACK